MNTSKRVDEIRPDLKKVADIVITAAEIIIRGRSSNLSTEVKQDGSLVTEVDEGMQNHIQKRLMANWPKYGFVGEEMSYDDQVKEVEANGDGYWVLDPLDGTTNFISGFLFYGVSLALVINGHPVLAVVYDPVREECFSAEIGKGSYLNGHRLITPGTHLLSDCVANVDYKRLVGDLSSQLVRCPPYRSQRNLGSSVLEWCWLASGRIQLYLHGGQKLWDYSAGYLILTEAGGAATSLSGLPLDCSKLRKRSVVAAVNAGLLEQWEKWIFDNSELSQSEPY